jgi:glycosyltransferase involved in cell wall biosynthesis
MKISVITVCYNSKKTIADTLLSVRSQNHPYIEHIIVDGGSEDETLAVVAIEGMPNHVLISEKDEGIYDAMNKGLKRASGDVIGFLNSDDFYADSDVLGKVAAVFQDESVEACYADLVYVTPDNSRVARHWKSKVFAKGDFAKGWCPAHPTFYVRRSALERLDLFDQSFKLAADVEFMMRYLEGGKVKSVYIPHVLVRMRLGGATNQSWGNILQQNREIFVALQKNKVPFNPLLFWGHKIFDFLI